MSATARTKDVPPHGEAGFSLTELLVAMVITLIITGAMYSLLTSGQGAFRREPQLTDKQQAARVGMSLLQRDLQVAGQGLGEFVQAFSVGGNNFTNGQSSPLVPGEKTDFLQLFGDDGECAQVPATGVNGSNVETKPYTIPPCYPEDSFLMVLYPGVTGPSMKLGMAHKIHAQDTYVNFPTGLQPGISEITNNNDLKSPEMPSGIAVVQFIRYEIALDSDGIPSLWRTGTGGVDTATGTYAAPAQGIGGWQLVARGVDDLQVQYLDGSGAWADQPPTVVAGNYATIVRQVRIRLSSRTVQTRLLGPNNTNPIRGELTAIVSPRAALFALSKAATPLWQ